MLLRARSKQTPSRQGLPIVTSGRKPSYFKFRNYNVAGAFGGYSDSPSYENAREIAQAAVAMYESGEVDRIELVYPIHHSGQPRSRASAFGSAHRGSDRRWRR